MTGTMRRSGICCIRRIASVPPITGILISTSTQIGLHSLSACHRLQAVDRLADLDAQTVWVASAFTNRCSM
jgi:uncharacterized ParB-like nuclease family protein